MSILILVRHGQSLWNLENRFTGKTDIELTPLGETEAANAGILLRGLHIDVAFTSVLRRAVHTLNIILTKIDTKPQVIASSALNERNYGNLQGLNKAEVEKQYGSKQLALWRRSFNTAPPEGESLKDTYNRILPYYLKEIEPELKSGKNVLIVAHGNSLRALMMYLENISVTAIAGVTIATGIPRIYSYTKKMELTDVHYITNSSSETAVQ
ncbi:2,3-bisphosphoglycerate-dependent phosphoglycerate mutase [Flavobacterium sp.]|uniref:2,3-bisphosphoglycerate-dependent phosphoglycerate mutase n=1 Tax=Flavobacterium sp. TaxID=239 RepID=UPI003264BE3C